jgi:hypothetical protein
MVIAVITFVSAIVSNAKTYSYENLHRSCRPVPYYYFVGYRILVSGNSQQLIRTLFHIASTPNHPQ